MSLSRRQFLGGSLAATTSAMAPIRAIGAAAPMRLAVERRVIEVNKQPASVYGIVGLDGRRGLALDPGERFRVMLENRAGLPTLIHWHGQTPPLAQDGVPGLSQPLLQPDRAYEYDYAPRPGTHWMHSHEGLHEQLLMAAPLIVREASAPDVREVVVMLHDFTFSDAAEVFARLGSGQGGHAMHGAGAAMDHSAHAGAALSAHLHDVEYDAFLANDRTLDDPEVVRVERGERVRLRLINAATATAFVIDTGAVPAQAIAVDGNPVAPVPGRRFPMAMGQRLDLMLALPRENGAWPVFARREGDTTRTGIVLATRAARVAKIAAKGQTKAATVGLEQEPTMEHVVLKYRNQQWELPAGMTARARSQAEGDAGREAALYLDAERGDVRPAPATGGPPGRARAPDLREPDQHDAPHAPARAPLPGRRAGRPADRGRDARHGRRARPGRPRYRRLRRRQPRRVDAPLPQPLSHGRRDDDDSQVRSLAARGRPWRRASTCQRSDSSPTIRRSRAATTSGRQSSAWSTTIARTYSPSRRAQAKVSTAQPRICRTWRTRERNQGSAGPVSSK
jgi:FtsP/CotA-like multicopper oxidase with cupredoxin domain